MCKAKNVNVYKVSVKLLFAEHTIRTDCRITEKKTSFRII